MDLSKATLLLFALIFLPPLAASGLAAGSLSADQALTRLREGHSRFISGTQEYPHTSQDRRQELVSGQHPFVTILGCSDSRVPLEVLFDTGLGDIFTVRVAGNVADTDEIATVEYGTAHLGTTLVVVLGHSLCGAVTAVVSGAEAEGSLPGLLDNVSAPAARARAALGSSAPLEDLVERAVTENTRQSMADLLVRSPVVSELVEAGKVQVVGAVYHLETGDIQWLGEHPDQERLLTLSLSSSGSETGSWVLSLVMVYGIPLTASGLLFFLVFRLFVSGSRVFSGMKIRGRLTASFLGFAGILGLVQIYLSLLPGEVTGSFPTGSGLWPVLFLTVPFALWYAVVHEKIIKEFIAELRQRWSEGI